MPFIARNALYLRISNSMVLPTYLYLDERHVHWMSDTILQFVLSDLRPYLLSKLKAEANIILGGNASKKSTVDTHRGETYQFCYFLRKTDPHSVIVKSRRFRAVQTPQTRAEDPPRNKKGKRKENPIGNSIRTSRSKKPRINDGEEAAIEEGEDVDMNELQDNTNVLNSQDVLVEDALHLEVDGEEEKPKPALSLKYQGFNIYGHCLCIVVEPWPVIRAVTTDVGLPKSAQTAPEPLFLADEANDEDTANFPANTGQFINKTYLEQVLSDAEGVEDEDTGGMMEFSQVLQNIGDSRAGAMNDDDDMDGSVLFGDADEQREF